MRSHQIALLLASFAACEPHGDPGIPDARVIHSDPDAFVPCGVGGFQIVAPVEGLHYAPHMIVVVDTSELDSESDVQYTMVDDSGASYTPVAFTTGTNPTDAGNWWRQDRYTYDLAPSRHYTLTGVYCPGSIWEQTITFFTSPQ
jgi:hypothetical protein